MASGSSFLSADACARLFPFHISVNQALEIVDLGQSIARILPALGSGQALFEHLDLLRPRLRERSYAAVREQPRAVYLLRARALPLTLRGQFVCDEHDGEPMAVFVGSPWVTKAEELGPLGLTFSDFAVHDPLADMIVLMRAQQQSMQESQQLADELRLQRNILRETAAMLEDKLDEVRTQRDLIRELSTPVLRIRDDLFVLPIVGQLDRGRADLMMNTALDAAHHAGARVVLIDLTGVGQFGPDIVAHLERVAGALRLLGTRSALVGISPELAKVLASSQAELDGLETYATLADAMRLA